VVDVRVCDEYRLAARADVGELEPQLPGVGPWVDDRSVGNAALGADDVAVRLVRTKRICVDCQSHLASLTRPRQRFVGLCSRATQRRYAKRSSVYVKGMKRAV
jgi:hypothetical protein